MELPYVEETYAQLIRQQMLSPTLQPNRAGIARILGLSAQLGGLEAVPPLDQWIDLSYLERASR